MLLVGMPKYVDLLMRSMAKSVLLRRTTTDKISITFVFKLYVAVPEVSACVVCVIVH